MSASGLKAIARWLVLVSACAFASPAGSVSLTEERVSDPLVDPLSLPQPAGAPGVLNLARLGGFIEKNVGQADPRARYLARGRGYTVFITDTEAVIALFPGQRLDGRVEDSRPIDVVRMRFVGGNPKPAFTAGQALRGKVHYLKGARRSEWVRNVPTYAEVKARSVYPGVDVVYRASDKGLEYNVEVAPGFDAGVVELAFEGAQGVSVDGEGVLVIETPNGELRHSKPLLYQEVNGRKVPVDGGYVARGGGRIGFDVKARDRGRALVIDPTLSYATNVGGSLLDEIRDIAVDSQGNTYVTGHTRSTNLPTTSGVIQPGPGANKLMDAFVGKLNADGSAFEYLTYLGGDDPDRAQGLAIDASGNAYVAGYTDSATTFPLQNAFQPTLGGTRDAFVSKLNATGTALSYSTFLGGSGAEVAWAIAVDATGRATVVGDTTSSTDFPTVLAEQGAYGGGVSDAFVATLKADGSAMDYATYLGGNDEDRAYGVVVGSVSEAYVVGKTASSDFPTESPEQSSHGGGTNDAFLSELDSSGVMTYSTYLGGNKSDYARGVDLDSTG